MASKSKIWYSFLGGKSYDSDNGFYEKENFKWTTLIEENFDIISNELNSYLLDHEHNIKPYFNSSLVTSNSVWKAKAFLFWMFGRRNDISDCPKTMNILSKVPGVSSVFVSILEAGSEIKPHRGDTNAIIRCHLPLHVPSSLPKCGFKVGYEERSWEEGKLLMFNDAARHTAWNLTEKPRYVLLFDVIRPEFWIYRYTISSKVLSSLIVQGVFHKLKLSSYLPSSLSKSLIYINALWIYILLRIRGYTS